MMLDNQLSSALSKPEIDGENLYSEGSAAANGLVSCNVCHGLSDSGEEYCLDCGSKLAVRIKHSVQKTLALLIASVIFYIPANLYPIMQTKVLGSTLENSILSGVLLFLEEGAYFVAGVIFVASIIIPITKMLAIYWLCRSVMSSKPIKRQELTKLYALTEFIGKWSMIDVFVVAILVALIQVGNLMTITPGLAAASFAIVVILTMCSAQCFDSRLLWDKAQ
ncbi:MAG: paraquat-inducible protein A [Oceanospirillaceae bacterium]